MEVERVVRHKTEDDDKWLDEGMDWFEVSK